MPFKRTDALLFYGSHLRWNASSPLYNPLGGTLSFSSQQEDGACSYSRNLRKSHCPGRKWDVGTGGKLFGHDEQKRKMRERRNKRKMLERE
ncbi:hypothetical protein ACLOJK_016287 [Asimina triloba]